MKLYTECTEIKHEIVYWMYWIMKLYTECTEIKHEIVYWM